MNKDKLDLILDAHTKWLQCDENGKRADLRGANLRGANLRGANLRDANLWGANLRGANLRDANLWGADLWGANLRGANLWSANLWGANLRGANLRGANLWSANLRGANLRGANLWSADLRDADLQDADLWGADLRDADLRDADLPFFQICHGELLVWKKARDNRLVQLKIPAEAKRTAALVGRKCRAEYAVVVAITNAAGEAFTDAESSHDGTIIYRVGGTIRPDSYNDDIRIECANGIHFFQTREEAEAY